MERRSAPSRLSIRARTSSPRHWSTVSPRSPPPLLQWGLTPSRSATPAITKRNRRLPPQPRSPSPALPIFRFRYPLPRLTSPTAPPPAPPSPLRPSMASRLRPPSPARVHPPTPRARLLRRPSPLPVAPPPPPSPSRPASSPHLWHRVGLP